MQSLNNDSDVNGPLEVGYYDLCNSLVIFAVLRCATLDAVITHTFVNHGLLAHASAFVDDLCSGAVS